MSSGLVLNKRFWRPVGEPIDPDFDDELGALPLLEKIGRCGRLDLSWVESNRDLTEGGSDKRALAHLRYREGREKKREAERAAAEAKAEEARAVLLEDSLKTKKESDEARAARWEVERQVNEAKAEAHRRLRQEQQDRDDQRKECNTRMWFARIRHAEQSKTLPSPFHVGHVAWVFSLPFYDAEDILRRCAKLGLLNEC